MTLRYFYIAVLATLTLVFVYGNKPLADYLTGLQTRMLDALALKFPSLGNFHWTATSLSRPLIAGLLYALAIVCLVTAILLWQVQMTPPPQPH